MVNRDTRYRIFIVCLIASVAIRVFFWIYTQRIWEDTLITVRHAENAAAGLGLTHHTGHGQLVHGFTSAISVLIPLASELIVSGSGIAFQKFVSILAAAITIWVGYRIATHSQVELSPSATLFWLGFLALEHHQILFGMSGMETQCVVLATLFAVWQGLEENWKWMGLACGITIWARPDGVVLVSGLLAYTFFRAGLRPAVQAGLIAALTILPWILFATWYYGQPIPHTILAKRVGSVSSAQKDLSGLAWLQYQAHEMAGRVVRMRNWLSPAFVTAGSPINNFRGARPIQFTYFTFLVIGFVGSLSGRKATSAIAWSFLALSTYFIVFMSLPAPWYMPPWLALAALTFCLGIDQATKWLQRWIWVQRFVLSIPLVILCCYVANLTKTIPAEKIIQRDIENAVRMKAGIWLNQHTREDEWIGLECLGYFGYYSNRPMLDFPGLASPRSLAVQAKNPGDMIAFFANSQADWLALRPHEWESLKKRFPQAASQYSLIKRFDAQEEAVDALDKALGLTGGKVSTDTSFLLLQKQE